MGFQLFVRDWLLANDPAFSRLRLALRVTLTILLTVLLLAGIHLWITPMPAAAYSLGVTLAMQSGLSVKDASPSAQFVTRMTGGLTGVAIVALAASLEGQRYLSDVVFLLVIFCASYARAFGPRGFAIGMFAFMSYFIGAYLHPSLDQVPATALGAMIAVLVAQAMRVLILPDHPARDLYRALVSVDQRIEQILEDLASVAGRAEPTRRQREKLNRAVERLKDAVLMAESFVPAETREKGTADDTPLSAVSIALFDLHLAAESTVVLCLQAAPPDRLAAAMLSGGEERIRRAGHKALKTADGATIETIRGLLRLDDMRRRLRKAAAAATQDMSTAVAPAGSSVLPPAPYRFKLDKQALKTSVQITLASGVAMAFGLMLSRERWFWAVLSAFLVFTNTRSRGDTAIKALQRSVGTMLGIGTGLLAAILLQGHEVVILAIAFVCTFFAFYLLAISYAAMTFFVSVVLALVYSLLGVLSFSLLQLRLEETLIGAVAGTAVAFLVFPSRTQVPLDDALGKWTAILGAMLDDAAKGNTGLPLVIRSQQLERAYQELAVAARPLGASWALVTRPGTVRQTLLIFMACTYWARMFAQASFHQPAAEHDRLQARITANLAVLDDIRRRGAQNFRERRSQPATERPHLALSEESLLLSVEMIGLSLARLQPPNDMAKPELPS